MATWVESIMENHVVQQIVANHQFDNDFLEKNHFAIDKFIDNYVSCVLDQPCQQKIKGFCYSLRYEQNHFVVGMTRCAHGQAEDAKTAFKSNYVYYDFGEENLKVDIRTDFNFKLSESRVQMSPVLSGFAKLFKDRKKNGGLDVPFIKGLYLYGTPGLGKTYFLIALANWFAKRNYKVGFINVTNLSAKLKENFDDDNNYALVYRQLMNCDVLMLDDIGGELISKWFRDEILFNLLNYRLNCKKMTFFSSNYDIQKLSNLYGNVRGEDGEINRIKACRLIERINALSQGVELTGKSLRK